MSQKSCRPTICSIFYQAKEFKNIESFYTLKKLEWQANREHEAAIKIQAFFRKWLMTKNLQLLHQAAIKIQSRIRGFLGRRRVARIREDLELQKDEDDRNKAATIIQAAWRGYLSRKNNFNYYKYKSIREKNEAYYNSINAINELESLATLSARNSQDRISLEIETTLKRLLDEDNLEAILKLSPSRVCALQAYIDEINAKCMRRGYRPAKKNIALAEKLAEQCWKLTHRDSVDDMFPDLTEIPGVIQPDREKAERLKEAIRKLRENIVMDEQEALIKQHHLLRTYQHPGVLSDVATHALTPTEKKLKALKFWQEPPPDLPCTFPQRPKQKKLQAVFKADATLPRVSSVPVFMDEFICKGCEKKEAPRKTNLNCG